jgi:hypothetical protein
VPWKGSLLWPNWLWFSSSSQKCSGRKRCVSLSSTLICRAHVLHFGNSFAWHEDLHNVSTKVCSLCSYIIFFFYSFATYGLR